MGGGVPGAGGRNNFNAKAGDRGIVRGDGGELIKTDQGTGVVAGVAQAEHIGHEADLAVFGRALGEDAAGGHRQGYDRDGKQQREKRTGGERGFHGVGVKIDQRVEGEKSAASKRTGTVRREGSSRSGEVLVTSIVASSALIDSMR